MNTNFLGTTRKRNVNLGNRRLGLSSQNKSSFLQSIEQQRIQREEQRKKTSSAKVIQSAIRSHLDLLKTKTKIGKEWDGSNLAEFNFFFGSFVLSQPYEESAKLLDELHLTISKKDILSQSSQRTTTLVDTLMGSVVSISKESPDTDLIEKHLEIINEVLENSSANVNRDQLDFFSFLKAVLGVCQKSQYCYETFLLYSVQYPLISLKFLNTYNPGFFHGYKDVTQLTSLIRSQISYIESNPTVFDDFTDNQKFEYLMNILVFLFDVLDNYQSMLNSSLIKALSILLGGITCGLIFKMDTDDDDDDVDMDSDLRKITSRSDAESKESIHVNSDFYLLISKMYMGSFSKDILRACDLLKVDSDTQVLFFYSLLQFVTPKGSGFDASVNSSFKNNIIVTLIVSSGSINFLSSW
ncbi:unnamed protein product [Ambrosiozyma monospora]|uniref:Unnamed protein product n=1 Tax=Ambrosiozyma monospora TaxID=43982 RepID=A0ACB5SZL2_AMBMO|nr:unnamed protein product [Ambrosiozyma monospora]